MPAQQKVSPLHTLHSLLITKLRIASYRPRYLRYEQSPGRQLELDAQRKASEGHDQELTWCERPAALLHLKKAPASFQSGQSLAVQLQAVILHTSLGDLKCEIFCEEVGLNLCDRSARSLHCKHALA